MFVCRFSSIVLVQLQCATQQVLNSIPIVRPQKEMTALPTSDRLLIVARW